MRYLRKMKEGLLKGVALVRLDFNSEDAWRMEAALPTLRFLEPIAEKIVIISHRGRPNGFEKKLSLVHDAGKLTKLFGKKVVFINNFSWGDIRMRIADAPRGSIFLLENLRFLPEEELNDVSLAKHLASLADYYVNDAFAVSHRVNASVVAITRYLPSYAGFQMEREIEILEGAIQKPAKPLVLILGGSKAEDKLGVINTFLPRADTILLGGTPANVMLALRGTEVSVSSTAYDPALTRAFAPLIKSSKCLVPVDGSKDKGIILDIGPETIALWSPKIARAQMIIWNGPPGFFEKKAFSSGTKALVELLSRSNARIIMGGGETIAAFHMFAPRTSHLAPHFFISTGGGAMLEFLAGKKLPGIVALER